MVVNMKQFRFQDLEIWKDAIEIANTLFNIADDLEKKKFFRFSEQLRGAAMSISNNIAEGSGASSDKQFVRYLDIARQSTYELANIAILLSKRNLISIEEQNDILKKLDIESRKITNFQKSLLR